MHGTKIHACPYLCPGCIAFCQNSKHGTPPTCRFLSLESSDGIQASLLFEALNVFSLTKLPRLDGSACSREGHGPTLIKPWLINPWQSHHLGHAIWLQAQGHCSCT